MKKEAADKGMKKYAIERNYTALGNYLQEMRLRANMTQRAVSIALGYSSPQFISNFENGISSPPLNKLRALINLYGMSDSKVLALMLEGEKQVIQTALASSRRKGKKKS